MQQHHHLTAREWDELAHDFDFRALQRERRRFTVPATIFALLFFFALPLSVAIAPRFMMEPIAGAFNRAACLALFEFAMAWMMLALYMKVAKKFDARAEAIVQQARERYSQ